VILADVEKKTSFLSVLLKSLFGHVQCFLKKGCCFKKRLVMLHQTRLVMLHQPHSNINQTRLVMLHQPHSNRLTV
jgi:hypothetical protein